ncbi:hypothetical protein D9M69_616980 [compost metagenome]
MQYRGVASFIKGMFTPALFIPVLCCVVLMFVSPYYFINILTTILLYGILNLKQIKGIVQGGYDIITKKDILSID